MTDVGVGDLHLPQHRQRALARLAARSTPRAVKTSASCLPTRIDGFSAVPGFW